MTSGSRSLLAIALLILGAVVATGADKKSGKKSDKKNVEAYALIAGTVFRESGFALPGAEVTLTPEAGEAPNAKNKKLKAISDARGEFAFRVPPLPWRYTVSATMKGFSAESKTVSVSAEERIDVTFSLPAESK